MSSPVTPFLWLQFTRNLAFEIPIWSFYSIQYCGLSLSSAVAIYSFAFFVQGIADLPTSSWADRFGRRNLLLAGGTFGSLGLLLAALIPNAIGLSVSSLFLGLSWAFGIGSDQALLHDNLKFLQRESEYPSAYSQVMIAGYTGRILSFLVTGLLFNLDPRLPYILSSFTTFFGLLIIRSIVEHPYQPTRARNDFAQLFQAARVFFSLPLLLVFQLTLLALYVAGDQLWIIFQPQLQAHNIGPIGSGLSFALAAATSIVGTYTAKRCMKAGRYGLCMAMSALFFASGGVMFVTLRGLAGAVLAQSVASVGFGFVYAGGSALSNRHLPSSHRATCLSIVSSLHWALMGGLGAVAGMASERYGVAVVPLSVAGVCLLVLPVAARSAERLNRQ